MFSVMLWWHLILCSVLHHITDTCSHSTYSHIPTPTWLPFNRWSYVCSPRSINHLPQYPRHRQLQYFCRLLGLQLLFLLCQLLILLRRNCDLAISSLACVFWFGIKSRKMVVVGTIFFCFFFFFIQFSFSFYYYYVVVIHQVRNIPRVQGLVHNCLN